MKELIAKIAQVYKQGWSLVNQELEENLASIAASTCQPRRPDSEDTAPAQNKIRQRQNVRH